MANLDEGLLGRVRANIAGAIHSITLLHERSSDLLLSGKPALFTADEHTSSTELIVRLENLKGAINALKSTCNFTDPKYAIAIIKAQRSTLANASRTLQEMESLLKPQPFQDYLREQKGADILETFERIFSQETKPLLSVDPTLSDEDIYRHYKTTSAELAASAKKVE